MEIKTLRYFLAVAREENMTRAAENLHGVDAFVFALIDGDAAGHRLLPFEPGTHFILAGAAGAVEADLVSGCHIPRGEIKVLLFHAAPHSSGKTRCRMPRTAVISPTLSSSSA